MNRTLSQLSALMRYEIKVLTKSWFFIIFASLIVIIIAVANLGLIFGGHAYYTWPLFATPNIYVLYNMRFMNILQLMVAVFMATDFVKRDQKLDVTPIIFSRPLSNSLYVFGKMLGVLTVFLMLDILFVSLLLLVNLLHPNILFDPSSYIVGLFAYQLPSLIFMSGVAFSIMLRLKNQALSFIILLALVIACSFFLNEYLYQIFDIGLMGVPLYFSKLFGEEWKFLIPHRLAYFLSGLGFIFISVGQLNRLANDAREKVVSYAVGLFFIGAGVFFGYRYWSQLDQMETKRQEILAQTKHFAEYPEPVVDACSLKVAHEGKELVVEASLKLANPQDIPADSLLFRLNSGLEVDKVTSGGKELPFERKAHLLMIDKKTLPQTNPELKICYRGQVSEVDAFFMNENWFKPHEMGEWVSFNVRHAYQNEDYVVLNPNSLWYPQPGVGVDPDRPFEVKRNFTHFDLEVKTRPDLTAVSQGNVKQDSLGTYCFADSIPFTGISLIIGSYEKRSITVDSVEYSLYSYKGHGNFKEKLNLIADTIPHVIRKKKEEYELRLGNPYPFNRLRLVEAPFPINAYGTDFVQPELVLLSENGGRLIESNFAMEKMPWEKVDETKSEKEKQADRFAKFVGNAILGRSSGYWSQRIPFEMQYYRLSNFLDWKAWPYLEFTMEKRLMGNHMSWQERGALNGWYTRLTPQDKANSLLTEYTMDEILEGKAGNPEKVKNVLQTRGDFIFYQLEHLVGEDSLKAYVEDFVGRYRFRKAGMEEFVSGMEQRFSVEISDKLDEWIHSGDLPAYLLKNVRVSEFESKNRKYYHLIYELENESQTDGIVMAEYRYRSSHRNWRRPDEDTQKDILFIPKGKTLKVSLVYTTRIERFSINTLFSKNLPARIGETLLLSKPFEGERQESYTEILSDAKKEDKPLEIIVDNTDEGFFVHSTESSEKTLKAWWDKRKKEKEQKEKEKSNQGSEEEKYSYASRYWVPRKWKEVIAHSYYGDFLRTAHYIRSGTGEDFVEWNTEIPVSGTYEVLAYTSSPRTWWRRNRKKKAYNYTVYNDDGEDKVSLKINQNMGSKWYSLGEFYFTKGKAKVRLTNKSNTRSVIADAVKWVKK